MSIKNRHISATASSLDRHDGDPEMLIQGLLGKTVAVLGYGNQGRAHALNLRDSGVRVLVGGKDSSATRRLARSDGFEAMGLAEAATSADLVVFAVPDIAHLPVWQSISAAIGPQAILGFLHGFSVHFGIVRPPANHGVVMVAPKGPGASLRSKYLQGSGLLALVATAQPGSNPEIANAIMMAWASGIGSSRVGIVRTTFKDETETDLFGEQAVLCGGVSALAVAAFEVMLEQGYPPELAYNECCQELQLIGDMIAKGGIAGMLAGISPTAAFGAARAAPLLVDDRTRLTMRTLLQEIRSGDFARAMQADAESGSTKVDSMRSSAASHPMEAARLRLKELSTPQASSTTAV
ncbi:MAG: ketol-acid reductoisomerase [Phycisphaerales bacterium]|nr:ketol-acid reductoisomerase [Phycisphaerales bacterium]